MNTMPVYLTPSEREFVKLMMSLDSGSLGLTRSQQNLAVAIKRKLQTASNIEAKEKNS